MSPAMDSFRIEKEAADWLARRDSGQWSELDEHGFADWQGQSTAHRIAVIRLKTVWQHADRLQALGAGVPAGTIPTPGQWRLSALSKKKQALESNADKKHSSFFARRSRAAVAGIVLALSAGLIGYLGYFQSRDPNAYRTAVGGTQAVRLADGSQVTLNTDSQIRLAVTDTERRIELQRGEAFFDVARDPNRPFIVAAAGKRVIAVGTRFSVMRMGDEVRVVVTEGSVRIEQESGAGRSLAPVRLAAGGIARAGAAGVVVTQDSVPAAEQTLSWRSGYIVLRDTALADAVAEFNRYNTRKLEIADPALRDLRIGGNLRLNNLDAFARVLEQGFSIRAETRDERIILTKR